MLSIDQYFGKHCSCHLQGECVVGRVLETLGSELDLMVLIGGTEEWAIIQWERSMSEIFSIFFYVHMVGKGDGRRGSGDHVRQEMISNDYVEMSGGDLLLLSKIYEFCHISRVFNL
jgi:hypothetical protein